MQLGRLDSNAKFFCGCANPEKKICGEHIFMHVSSLPCQNHKIMPFYVDLSSSRPLYIDSLSNWINYLDQLKNVYQNQLSQIITIIFNETNENIEKIHNLKQKYIRALRKLRENNYICYENFDKEIWNIISSGQEGVNNINALIQNETSTFKNLSFFIYEETKSEAEEYKKKYELINDELEALKLHCRINAEEFSGFDEMNFERKDVYNINKTTEAKRSSEIQELTQEKWAAELECPSNIIRSSDAERMPDEISWVPEVQNSSEIQNEPLRKIPLNRKAEIEARRIRDNVLNAFKKKW